MSRRRCVGGRRGAALYLAVLSTALIVSLLGLAGLTVVRIERKQVSTANDLLVARANARSAVELAQCVLAADPDWRTNYSNGVETAPKSLGPDSSGTLSWILEDSDGSLIDADTDLRLKGIGRVNTTVQVSSVGLNNKALSCLEIAVCGNGQITFWSSSTISTNQTIFSNTGVDTNSGTIVNSGVEAVGAITGPGYMGPTTTPVPERKTPSASAFNYYLVNGTVIDLAALPKVSGKRTIQDVVLSPGNNPYGATNPAGIYIIDCASNDIFIQHSRIIATLVLINPKASSTISGEISWEPAAANYPALLVQGGVFNFAAQNAPLDESDRGVNFNPLGSPYQGSTNVDLADLYPSVIQGIVYVSGDAIVTANHPQFDGVVITGDELKVNSGESLSVTYDSSYLSNPPPGFLDQELSVTPGSWLWDAAP